MHAGNRAKEAQDASTHFATYLCDPPTPYIAYLRQGQASFLAQKAPWGGEWGCGGSGWQLEISWEMPSHGLIFWGGVSSGWVGG